MCCALPRATVSRASAPSMRTARPSSSAEPEIPMTERKRIAIIGLGMALKPHLESLRELGQRVEIAACYTPSAARRAAAAAQGLVVASDLDQMLADPGIAA